MKNQWPPLKTYLVSSLRPSAHSTGVVGLVPSRNAGVRALKVAVVRSEQPNQTKLRLEKRITLYVAVHAWRTLRSAPEMALSSTVQQ